MNGEKQPGPVTDEPAEETRLLSGPVERTNLYRGAADCKARVIYGAPGWDGNRRGKVILEQVPDRSVIRLRVLGFTDATGRRPAAAEIGLDAEGWDALREATQGYNGALEKPKRQKPEDRVSDLMNELDQIGGLSPRLREAVDRAQRAYLGVLDGEVQKGPAANGARRRMALDEEIPAQLMPEIKTTAPPFANALKAERPDFDRLRASAESAPATYEFDPPDGGAVDVDPRD